MMKSYSDLIKGYKAFRQDYQGEPHQAYREQAAEGQQPQVMVIGCSDSRVNPALMTQAGLGDLFVVHNVANIVPAPQSALQDFGAPNTIGYNTNSI